MFISDAFGAVVGAAHSAIEALATLLTPAAGSLATAAAIIVFTLLVRVLISPITYLQVRGERRRAALNPEIEKLREKHGDDPMTLATESLALRRANGINPFAAFLPALAQAPFFMIMYRVAMNAPAGAVFGVPLTAHLIAGLPVFAVLIAIAVLIGRWSSRRMPPEAPRLLRVMPYLTVLAVAWLPLAGALYLVTSASWTALEHAVLRKPVTTGNR
ncbi:YidC/Oxa1 family membrane protein insertase [Actinoplanes tereljensis]|uniref:Membrane protein insertase YidC n=1 Tax=Paractinoplanes tereljensis TaxID=571912 RepID=A0A919NT91_9ACTN|nr:membrane protein insertase YidC [Actinoplanes tereljensis]GIF24715.1 protein translocase component YidC [Actinoplanes tereljensis]